MHQKVTQMHMQLQNLAVNRCSTNTHPFVDGKDGAYGGQTVNVGGAIQRIKTDYILSLWQTAAWTEYAAEMRRRPHVVIIWMNSNKYALAQGT